VAEPARKFLAPVLGLHLKAEEQTQAQTVLLIQAVVDMGILAQAALAS